MGGHGAIVIAETPECNVVAEAPRAGWIVAWMDMNRLDGITLGGLITLRPEEDAISAQIVVENFLRYANVDPLVQTVARAEQPSRGDFDSGTVL